MTNLPPVFVGIDPGKSGAIAFLLPGAPPAVTSTPTIAVAGAKGKRVYDLPAMLALLHPVNGVLVVIEKTGVRPGEGVVSAHSIGYGAGLWIGMLTALHLPFIEVAPVTWRAAMIKGQPKAPTPKARKLQAALVAGQLFPATRLRGPQGGILDGHADALLLAEYGRRLRGGAL